MLAFCGLVVLSRPTRIVLAHVCSGAKGHSLRTIKSHYEGFDLATLHEWMWDVTGNMSLNHIAVLYDVRQRGSTIDWKLLLVA